VEKKLILLIALVQEQTKATPSTGRKVVFEDRYTSEFLGCQFVPTYVKGEKGKYQLVVSDKAWRNLKCEVKSVNYTKHL
jgi:hypothetical protein